MAELILKQTQKIGSSYRITLWNKKLNQAGFTSGTPIRIELINGGRIIITRDPNAKRKVSKVMNHGQELPVIDIKINKALPLDQIFNKGELITVELSNGLIEIYKKEF